MEGADWRRICITASLFYSVLAMGLLDIFFAPTLIEFARKLHTSIPTINIIYGLTYVPFLFASFAFGFVFSKVSRNVVVPPALLLIGSSIVTLPLANNVLLFTIILNVVLFAKGAFTAAEMTWLKDLWKERAGPYIQAQNFFKSLGHLITPWLFAPFLPTRNPLFRSAIAASTTSKVVSVVSRNLAPGLLETLQIFSNYSGEIKLLENETETSWTLSIWNSSSMEESPEKNADLSIPFEILGGLIGLAALFQFLTYIFFDLKPLKATANKEKRDIEKKEEAGKDITPFSFKTFKRELPLVIFITLAYAGAIAWNFYMLNFLPAAAYFSRLHLSESSASDLLGLTNIFYSIGGFAGILLNSRFNPRDILIGNTVLIGGGNLLLLYSLREEGHSDLAWVSCGIIGLGFSTTVPCVAAYGQLGMKFDTVVGAVVNTCSLLCFGVGFVLIALMLETEPCVLIYCNLAFVPIVLLSLWGFSCFQYRAGTQTQDVGTQTTSL